MNTPACMYRNIHSTEKHIDEIILSQHWAHFEMVYLEELYTNLKTSIEEKSTHLKVQSFLYLVPQRAD